MLFRSASCDGCQLTILDLEDELLAIGDLTPAERQQLDRYFLDGTGGGID